MKSYLIYNLYNVIVIESSGIAKGRRRPTLLAPEEGERIMEFGMGGRGVAGWRAGRDRDEVWRVRADRGSGARPGRERRGGRDLLGPGRLCGRGLFPTVYVAFAGAVIAIVAQRK